MGEVRESLITMIAADLEGSIANLGYPVGMGMAPSIEECRVAATSIVDRIQDKALEALSGREPTR